MRETEWNKFTGWVSAPLNTQMPLWQLGLLFLILIVVAFVVYDNMHILTTALES